MNNKKLVKIITLVLLIVSLSLMLTACSDVYPMDKDGKFDLSAMTFGQKMAFGGEVALLGIAFVFIVLLLLIFLVNMLKYVMKGIETLSKVRADKKAANIDNVTIQDNTTSVINNQEEQDEEIVAAITAALYAYYEAQASEVEYKSNLKFKVRSIKEIK